MEIRLYNCSDPTIKLDKSLGDPIKTIDVDIPAAIDVVNPSIIVDNTSIPATANYMVCGAPLNRSYFIGAIEFSSAKTTIISGHCDVLSTYGSLVSSTTLNYVRGAENVNEIEDNSYPLSDCLITPSIAYHFSNWNGNFSNTDSGTRYILRTVASVARNEVIHTMNIGDEFRYLGRWVYRIAGDSEARAECVYDHESTSGTYTELKRLDIVQLGTYQYKFVVGSDYPTYGRLDPMF